MTEVSTGASGFQDRLAKIIQLAGSANGLARKAGISQGGIRKYQAGGEPNRQILVKLAQAAGVSLEWLATGEGPMHKGTDSGSGGIQEGVEALPLCSLAPSAGHGAFCEGDHVDEWVPIPKAVIAYMGVPSKHLCLVRVSGNSMQPDMNDGEILFADRRHSKVAADGIYIFRQDGTILVKRLQALPGGAVQVIAANPTFPSYIITPSAPPTDFQVLARIVGNLRKV